MTSLDDAICQKLKQSKQVGMSDSENNGTSGLACLLFLISYSVIHCFQLIFYKLFFNYWSYKYTGWAKSRLTVVSPFVSRFTSNLFLGCSKEQSLGEKSPHSG